MEKEMLGLYVSGHPLESYAETVNKIPHTSCGDIALAQAEDPEAPIKDGDRVTFIGILAGRKDKVTKTGSTMTFLDVEDTFGSVETVVFSNLFARTKHLFTENAPLVIRGRIDINETEAKIIADDISLLEEMTIPAETPTQTKLYIKFSLGKDFLLPQVKEILKKSSGSTPVYIFIEETRKTFVADAEFSVNPTENLLSELSDFLGKDCVVLK